MSVLLNSDNITIFKFPETGVVALCDELVDFVKSGQAERYDLDLSTARYHRDEWNNHCITIEKGK